MQIRPGASPTATRSAQASGTRQNRAMLFDDLLEANRRYSATFPHAGLAAVAAKGIAVVTCIDSRLEPLQMLGLVPGDAKILRNAGGRVSQDVLRSLILATNLLEVRGVAIMQHTECAVASPPGELEARVEAQIGRSLEGWDLRSIGDPDADLAADVDAVRGCPLIPDAVTVVGWRYDIRTGVVHEIVP